MESIKVFSEVTTLKRLRTSSLTQSHMHINKEHSNTELLLNAQPNETCILWRNIETLKSIRKTNQKL